MSRSVAQAANGSGDIATTVGGVATAAATRLQTTPSQNTGAQVPVASTSRAAPQPAKIAATPFEV